MFKRRVNRSEAILAPINLPKNAKQFHPQGRDNGYTREPRPTPRFYLGRYEATPDMRWALENIDLALLYETLPVHHGRALGCRSGVDLKPVRLPYHLPRAAMMAASKTSAAFAAMSAKGSKSKWANGMISQRSRGQPSRTRLELGQSG